MGGSGTLRGAHRVGPGPDGDELDAEDSLRSSTLSDSEVDAQEGEEAANALKFERGATIDRYIVIDRIGAGAMGVVYTAYDPRLDRRIALKVMHARPGPQAGDVVTRVLREAQALAKLSHPNVVAVYDANVLGEAVYLTMELVDGVSLTRWLKQAPRKVDEVLRVFIDAGRGLAGAHAAGLIHRDFKPESRRPSQTAPQPTDRPHSHSQGRSERVDVYPAAPGCSGVAQVLAKRWQRPGPPEDGRGPAHRAPQPCMKSTRPSGVPSTTSSGLR